MSEHTKEPWHVAVKQGGICICDEAGTAIAEVWLRGYRPRHEATARRIVAAVNACADINDPQAWIDNARFYSHETVSAITRQRDDLLAATRAAEAVLARQKWRDDSPDPEAIALRQLRAAIAGAEGAK